MKLLHFFILALMAITSGCEYDHGFTDLCPGCTSYAILNNEDWELDPYICSLEKKYLPGDSILSLSLSASVPDDIFYDNLLFFRIAFKEDSIDLPDTNSTIGSKVHFSIYQSGYDVDTDTYDVVPGTGSYYKVESVNHGLQTARIKFKLVMAEKGDTTATPRNNTYPAVLHITEGVADFVIHQR